MLLLKLLASFVSGLKDLADFLPASLATIISYFSAEVTRGIWKVVPMNGTDWPSPAANLATVEQQIKKILAGTGVDVPSLAAAGLFLTLFLLFTSDPLWIFVNWKTMNRFLMGKSMLLIEKITFN